jgi:HSP20 family protein
MSARLARSLTQIKGSSSRAAHLFAVTALAGGTHMAKAETSVPAKTEGEASAAGLTEWPRFGALRREIDRLFEDFDLGSRMPFRRALQDMEPFWRRDMTWTAPAVDMVEKDKEYELTAELPGMDEKDIELKIGNGMLTIKGEKQEQREEKKKDFFLSERRYGSFHRSFRLPEGVDADKIAATVKKGILTVTLPKTAEAQKPEKKIEVKAAR